MLSSTLISTSVSTSLFLPPNPKSQIPHPKFIYSFKRSSEPAIFYPLRPRNSNHKSPILPGVRRGVPQICNSSKSTPSLDDPDVEKEASVEKGINNSGGSGMGEGGRDWTTSILLFLLWSALLYYVFNLSPNQTPSRDMYFLEKLLNLKADDGFRMNQVLVSLWYIMGLWPIVYSMLLLPTGRSSNSSVRVWPFLVTSFFGGAYALLPYFILWRPPPPPIKGELQRWPINFLESKITAGVLGAAGLGLIMYAASAMGDWKEFYQYFRESKLVHATSLDFILLSTFAPFWVYNDMTARKCYDKYSWLLPVSLVPFVGPTLYLFLRPSSVTSARSE
ncbi:hypothetical protein Ancab_008187 [Ancistrocladus abbreviatus]